MSERRVAAICDRGVSPMLFEIVMEDSMPIRIRRGDKNIASTQQPDFIHSGYAPSDALFAGVLYGA
ncbi:MAG: hypothetical protein AB1744_08795 [Candidatus Zixiibacteriota bacterium]